MRPCQDHGSGLLPVTNQLGTEGAFQPTANNPASLEADPFPAEPSDEKSAPDDTLIAALLRTLRAGTKGKC
jgi:hypothetical protein